VRVPDPAPARLLIWSSIAGAVLWFSAPSGAAPPLVVALRGDACVLAPTGEQAQARCPCEAWPGRVRLLSGRHITLAGASADDLEAVPGIGPVRARAIVAAREAAGSLERLDELLRVPGIGPRTLERLRPYLTASSQADCADVEWT
jgi:competence protein ComEA